MRFLRLSLSVVALSACAAQTPTASNAPIKVLVLSTTHGFRHTEAIDASKPRLKAAEATSGMTFDITEDPATLTAQNLAQYDVLFLNNSTLRIAPVNPNDPASVAATKAGRAVSPTAITAAQQKAIADFVRGGKGLVAVHSAIDAFYGWDDYRDIVGGGLFERHPFTREARVIVEDQKNASVSHFGPSVNFREEYYYVDRNPRPVSHVLMSLDLTSVNDTTKTDHPLAYIRKYGAGRVYVNLLGHFGTTWNRDDFLTSILQGVRIAAGRIPADFSAK